ncbi:MAG: hypothetical protein WCY19_02465 [Candidatus Gastranaerophilaceae bacterium]
MSYPINQNINPKYSQSLTGANTPSLQNIDTQKIKEGINDNPVSKMTEQTNPMIYAGVFIPTAAAAYVGMNRFGDSCRGEYDKTMLGRLDNFGTKASKWKIFDNKISQGIKKGAKNTINFLDKWVVRKNQILKAFVHTPAMPENKMALTQMKGISADIATSAVQLFETYSKNGTEIDKVRKLLPEMAVESDDVVVKAYKDIVQNAYKYVEKIEEICNKMGTEAAVKMEHGGAIPWSKYFNKGNWFKKGTPVYLTDIFSNSKVVRKIFARTVHFDEYANKIRASKKGLSRLLLQVIEGLTNAGSGAAGGGAIIAAVMGAWFIADAINRTIKAPKGHGEKRKTFAENMLYNIGFYMTIPIATKTMHAFGGLRYIGMEEKGVGSVENYRTMLKNLNERVDAREITKKDYTMRTKVLARMKKGKTRIKKTDKPLVKVGKFLKNIIHRPLKWFFDKVYMTGNEFAKPFVAKDANKFTEVMKKIQFKARDFSAYPVRMLLFMLAFAPFFAKFFAKGSHLVFGRPTVSVLDDGKEEAKKEQKPGQVQPAVQPQPAIKPVQQGGPAIAAHASNNSYNNQTAPLKRESLVGMYKANPPAQRAVLTPSEPVRTYVPSSDGIKVKPGSDKDQFDKDIPEVNVAMDKADKAEKAARAFVKG